MVYLSGAKSNHFLTPPSSGRAFGPVFKAPVIFGFCAPFFRHLLSEREIYFLPGTANV